MRLILIDHCGSSLPVNIVINLHSFDREAAGNFPFTFIHKTLDSAPNSLWPFYKKLPKIMPFFNFASKRGQSFLAFCTLPGPRSKNFVPFWEFFHLFFFQNVAFNKYSCYIYNICHNLSFCKKLRSCNEGLGLLKLTDAALISINPSPSNVNFLEELIITISEFLANIEKRCPQCHLQRMDSAYSPGT